MGLFGKKADPITNRARALDGEIAALELEIKKLNRKLDQPAPPAPAPEGPRVMQTARPTPKNQSIPVREPIFESVDQAPPAGAAEPNSPHFNDLGVRKYDLPAAWRRLVAYFRGPSTHNAKLVSYLAAGSIRGLRPLRYEKRIARNRFVMMSIFFLAILWWLLAVIWKHR